MKIAYVYDCVYPWTKGGAEKRTWEIARRLAQRHEVHWYGIRWWAGGEVLEKDGILFHGVCEPMDLYVGGRRSIREALVFAFKLIRPLRAGQFDIIDCQQFPYFPCFTAKLSKPGRKTALVITWYEVWGNYWYEYLGAGGFVGKIVEREAMELPDVILPVSDRIRDELVRAGVRGPTMDVIPNGVDFNFIRGIPPAQDKVDVIYVGRLVEHKRVNVLLDALAQLQAIGRTVKTRIIGDGPEMNRLQGLRETLRLDNLQFLGFVEDHGQVISYLKAARVLVLPSTREGFPNTILEANACGVPCIVVDHPKNLATSVVTDGSNGFVVELSGQAIAEKIALVLDDHAMRERMRGASVEFARRFDWDRVTSDLERVYSRIAKSNAA